MIIQNCRFIFPSKTPQRRKVLHMCFFQPLIYIKTMSSKARESRKTIAASRQKLLLDSIMQSEISQFIDETKLYLLKPLFKSTKHFQIPYKFVVNYDVAKDIVDKILPHFTIDKDIIVEANPGLGFITLCLINSKVPKITVMDNSKLPDLSLNKIIELHKCNINIKDVNLFKFPRLQITDLIEDSIKSNSRTKVIGVIANNTFLINLMYTCIIIELWDTLHYLEFYLVVSRSVLMTIISHTLKKTRYFYTALFNFMFKFEYLGKYHTDAFLPISSNDLDSSTLLKITVNSELMQQISKDKLNSYVFFLDILSKNKETHIISTLEKFVPNCGLYFIREGVSITNTIRDFSPSECVSLFNVFTKCEGFDIFEKMSTANYGSTSEEFESNWKY